MKIINNKRFNTLNNYLREKYNSKVFKVSLNANMTCPNIDGSASYGGCSFCSAARSGDFAGDKMKSLKDQFNEVRDRMLQKWPNAKYIPYFQAGTNTHAPLPKLKLIFEEALTLDELNVGMSISTRPDCIDESIVKYLKTINDRCDLWVELGLQTSNEDTSKDINRAHDLLCFEEAVSLLRKYNIDVVVHIINGLPNETYEDMINTVNYLADKDIQGIKIHLLHIMKNTLMGKQYLENPFKVLTLEEYVKVTCDQLELLNPNIIVHRITGDAPKELLIAPIWSLKKFVVMNEIDKEMNRRGSFQGIKYKKIS